MRLLLENARFATSKDATDAPNARIGTALKSANWTTGLNTKTFVEPLRFLKNATGKEA